MAVRKARAVWEGTLKEGKGTMETWDGKIKGGYSFTSRFENGTGTNPEELLGAAHAGCFSMAFSLMLENAGFPPKRIVTGADVTIENTGQGFAITSIKLSTEADVPRIDAAEFNKIAEQAKRECPVSKALSGVPRIELVAKHV
jgi:lipoyl-dependent peroxiredoxin